MKPTKFNAQALANTARSEAANMKGRTMATILENWNECVKQAGFTGLYDFPLVGYTRKTSIAADLLSCAAQLDKFNEIEFNKRREANRVENVDVAHESAFLTDFGIDCLARVAMFGETVVSPFEAHDQAIAIDAAMPKPFTHSFYGNEPAQVVPAHTMIADAVIVVESKSHGGPKTAEYEEAIAAGFVFSNWLSVANHTMLMIKPAGVVRRYVKNTLGYRLESFCLNIRRNDDATHARAVVGARECGGIYFQISAVAGDIELRDLCDRLITLLSPKLHGDAHCEMIRKFTNQYK